MEDKQSQACLELGWERRERNAYVRAQVSATTSLRFYRKIIRVQRRQRCKTQNKRKGEERERERDKENK